MQVAAGEEVDIVGALVRCHYEPGQKYIQLIFTNEYGEFLALSRNAAMVGDLAVGEQYHIYGHEYAVAGKWYILEPEVQLAKVTGNGKRFAFSRRKKMALSGAMAALLIVAGVGVVLGSGGDSKKAIQAQNTGVSQGAAAAKQVIEDNDAAGVLGESSDSPAVDPSAATPAIAPKPSPKKVTNPPAPVAPPTNPSGQTPSNNIQLETPAQNNGTQNDTSNDIGTGTNMGTGSGDETDTENENTAGTDETAEVDPL